MRAKATALAYMDAFQAGGGGGMEGETLAVAGPCLEHNGQRATDMLSESCPSPEPLDSSPLPTDRSLQTDEARAEFWGTHAEPEAAKGQCRGAHMLYIDAFVAKHGKVRGVRRCVHQ
mgnify:CR=1 FL=1